MPESTLAVPTLHFGLLLLGIVAVLALLALASLTILPGALVDDSAYVNRSTGRIDRAAVANAKNEMSRALLQGVVVLGVGATAIFTWWRLRVAEFEANLGAQGQLAERLSRGIEHLAHESAIVRIGGIYTLERIAEQSTFDMPAIGRLLAGLAVEQSRQYGSRPDATLGDIEAALVALSRIDLETGPLEGIDLRGLSAPNIDLSWRIALEDALLADASLSGARFAGAWMPRADFSGADIARIDLANATMPNCVMHRAMASELRSGDADLRSLTAVEADLSRAWFGDVILYESAFDRANLQGVTFAGCDLSDSTFKGADLRNSIIGNCWLSRADFREADLRHATWHVTDGTLNEWDPSNPPIWPTDFDPPQRGESFWGSGPPPRGTS